MESWRSTFRKGFVPFITTEGLESLRDALRGDDPRLTQGSTTTPPPLQCVQDWPCEGADAIGWTGWRGGDNEACLTVVVVLIVLYLLFNGHAPKIDNLEKRVEQLELKLKDQPK